MRINTFKKMSPYGLIVLIVCLTLLPGTASLPLIDRDEPRFAQATREMADLGEWIIPYFNHEYRFDKPIMTYWLMRASYALFAEQNEFSARFASVLAALLTALIIFEIGRRWFNAKVGLWASGGWLTCLQVLIHGRMAVADMPLIMSIAISHWAIWELMNGERFRWLWFFALYGMLAFGFLTKGPIAFICPLLTVLLYRWVFWRKPLPWRKLKLHWGLPLAALLIAAWGAPALLESGGLFFQEGIGKHVVGRGMKPFNGRRFSLFFYFKSTIPSLFPGIAFLGGAWAVIRTHWCEKQAFLISWLVGPYLLFSFYASQLPHYVLPAYPAVFLLLGQNLNLAGEYSKLRAISFGAVAIVGIIAGGLLAGIALYETFPAEMSALRGMSICLAGVVLSLTLMAWVANARRWKVMVIPFLALAMSLSQGAAYFREVSPAVRMVPLFQAMPRETRCYYLGFEEPSLIYYSNRTWERFRQDPELNQTLAAGPVMIVLLKEEQELEKYLHFRLPRVFKNHQREIPHIENSLYPQLLQMGYRSQEVAGINAARLSWVKFDVWYKDR